MKYIYLGQCDVWKTELNGILAAGKDLKINGLMNDAELKDVFQSENDHGKSDYNHL